MNKSIWLVTVVLFLASVLTGVNIAREKPLWNDEVYSQKVSVQSLSFFQILAGKVPEGNNTPLFYTIQKMVSGIFRVEIPKYTEVGDWQDARGQMILRLPPIACMSFAIAFMFYFFARHFSWRAGLYAIVLTLSSITVWAYWAEARHYALWFLLTLLQSFVFLKIVWKKGTQENLWRKLMIVNFLLSITVIFGAAQIAVLSALLWIFYRKDWKAYIFPTVLPLCVSLFYYFTAPRYAFHLPPHISDPFLLNITVDQWVLISCGIGLALVTRIKQELYTAYLVAMCLLGAFLLLTLKQGSEGFEFTYRYFIFLTPMGIITTVLVLQRTLEWAKTNVWLTTNILIGIAGLLIVRIFNAIILILGLF